MAFAHAQRPTTFTPSKCNHENTKKGQSSIELDHSGLRLDTVHQAQVVA